MKRLADFFVVFCCFICIGCGCLGCGGSDCDDCDSLIVQTENVQLVSTGIPYEYRARVNSAIFPNYNGETHYMFGNPLTWGDANGIALVEMPEGDPVLQSPPFIATGVHLIRFSGGIIPETEKLAYLEDSGIFSIGANFLKNSIESLSEGDFVQPPPIIVDPFQKVAVVDLAYFGRPCGLRELDFYVAGDLVGGWDNSHIQLVLPTEDWKLIVLFTDETATKSWNIFWDVSGDFFIPESGNERAFLKSYLDLNALVGAGLGCYITKTATGAAYFQIQIE